MPRRSVHVAVLVPVDPERPMPPPERRPVGRAALRLRRRGVVAVFGDRFENGELVGVIAKPGRWEAGRWPVAAVHDRYPSQRRAARFAELRNAAATLPWGNPPALTLLCRDKLECQRQLAARGVEALPPVADGSDPLEAILGEWRVGFLKPRYGALGVGVRRVVAGDALPRALPSVVPGKDDPVILQRAVPPGDQWAGRSVRALCQRLPDGDWHRCPPVLRRSVTDPVVNAARGAELIPAEDALSVDVMNHIGSLCEDACRALAEVPGCTDALELGVDLVLDGGDRPWIVEVNSRPRGRLEALAQLDPRRFEAEHVDACARPLLTLAAWARQRG